MKKIILAFISIISISIQAQAQIEFSVKPFNYIVLRNSLSVNVNITEKVSLSYNRNKTMNSTWLDKEKFYQSNQIAVRYYWKSNNSGFFTSVFGGQKIQRKNFSETWREGGFINPIFGIIEPGILRSYSYDRVAKTTHLGIEHGYRWSLMKNVFFDTSMGFHQHITKKVFAENVSGEWDGTMPRYIDFPININLRLGVRLRLSVIEKDKFEFL